MAGPQGGRRGLTLGQALGLSLKSVLRTILRALIHSKSVLRAILRAKVSPGWCKNRPGNGPRRRGNQSEPKIRFENHLESPSPSKIRFESNLENQNQSRMAQKTARQRPKTEPRGTKTQHGSTKRIGSPPNEISTAIVLRLRAVWGARAGQNRSRNGSQK